jgi:CDP-glucose 4,6-dehydratase
MLEDPGFWRGRNVLVTGAGGFLASWICRALVEQAASVVGIVRDSAGERMLNIHLIRDDINLIYGSVTDFPVVERVFNEYEIDTCFHLAAQALVVAANRAPLSTFESNIRGTWMVLEAARQCQTVERVVVASSDKAYGDQKELPYREESELAGRYPYDASKVCADVLAQSYAATYELPVAVTRCANIYGGGDLNWSRIIPGTVRSVLRNERPIIRSDGTMERDYIYIGDAVDAYLVLGQRVAEDGVRGHAYNFGSSQAISVLDLVEKILAITKSKLEPHVLGTATGEIDRQYLDSSRAQRDLGWEPRFSLEEGLSSTIKWYADFLGVSGG